MAFMNAPATAEGGDFVAILAYNASAGRMFLRDREQDTNGEWHKKETDITMAQPPFAVDFGRLEVGWTYFAKGTAPQWAMAFHGQPIPPKPPSPGLDEKGKELHFRNGFRIPVCGNALSGVREFAGNSAAMINGMNELHTAFEASPEAAAGKIPVVKMVNVIPVKSGQATNFQPVFAIQAWVDRPEALGPRTVPPPMPRAQPAQAPVQASPVVPTPLPVMTEQPKSAAAPSAMPF